MAEFRPYTIRHVQWNSIEGLVLPPGPQYVVFWQGNLPLGHYWLEGGSTDAILDGHAAEIDKAVRPALEYYGGRSFASEEAALPSLSVVVCTRNRAPDLERNIKSLMDSVDSDFELIVVDNAPDDERTAELVARYPRVRYLHEPRPGLDIARNTGAMGARGEIVAFTDDDVEVTREWTRQLKMSFGDPRVMAVTGLVIPCSLDTPAEYIFERYWGFNKGYLPTLFDQAWFRAALPTGPPVWEIGAGANMAFRRDIFRLAGWFDERLDVGAAGCSGDSEMWYRVLAEGWNCQYLPHLVVYHHHRSTMKQLRRQLYYYMRGHVCASLVQHETYGHKGNLRRLYLTMPWYYLQRWIHSYFQKDPVVAGSGGTIGTEVRGCLSGWWYYRSGRKSARGNAKRDREPDKENLPEENALLKKVVVRKGACISVIIPSYNYREYLGAAIESVLKQSYPYKEIIVVDDGSTDGTDQLCRRYKTVRYTRVDRVGLSAARNIGVGMSKGDFVVFLDADDLLYPNALELNLYYFGYYPDAAFVSGGFDRIDSEGRMLGAPEPLARAGNNYNALLQGNYIGMEATVLYRRELFFRYFFDRSLTACEDYDLNLRIARDLPVYAHPHKIAAYRFHQRNMSNDRESMARVVMDVLKRQEPYLRNEEERDSYERGLENWKQYYGYGPHSHITTPH